MKTIFEAGDRIKWSSHWGTIIKVEGEETWTKWDKDNTYNGETVFHDTTLSRSFEKVPVNKVHEVVLREIVRLRNG